jgi:beta-galactosidase
MSPVFYRATFIAPDSAEGRLIPVYRVTYAGLSRGSIWLNGHNVGRYPEKIPGLQTLYLPECWLKKGENSLAIFDEEGSSPTAVTLIRDDLSSRELITLGR